MNAIEKDLKDLFILQGDDFENRLRELNQKYTNEADKSLLAQTLLEEMEETKQEMYRIGDVLDELTLKEQLRDITEIISMSYIAKHYFGKTRAWLYQRINGNPVRGKVYTLNSKEKDILNNALQDISKKIGSLSVN